MNSSRSASTCIFLMVVALSFRRIASDARVGALSPDERSSLIELRDSLSSIADLHSNWTGPPCYNGRSRWIGIACSGSHVIGIALDGIQLTGSLPPSALQSLTYLTNLSFSNNALHGLLPTLEGLHRLRAVSFSHNRFSGPIPIGFPSLPVLSRLELQDNLLNGTIPALDQQALAVFDVSYNFLEGQIPATAALQRFSSSSYDHNLKLCGRPLNKPCLVAPPSIPPPGPPPSPPSPRSRELKLWGLVLIALGSLMVLGMIIWCFLCCYKRCHKEPGKGDASGEASSCLSDKAARGAGDGGDPDRVVELVFFDKERPAFDLDDLLRSSAELIGRGRLGMTYRATLESGPVVVVKRLNGVGKREFAQQMRLLGGVRHENLVEIISFYCSMEEKLVIYEEVPGGSLFHLLHDNRGEGRVPLNWAARLCIVKGVARGLAYLHQSLPSHKVPHSNLKTSNVLIHHNTHHPKLTDFGLLPLLQSPQQSRKLAVGMTPEFSQGRRLTHKADVYCFGLVILEVITGQVPSEEEEDLSEWVRSAASIDWSTDILDLEIVAEKEGHEEMLRLTGIALECTAREPERRPKMSELVRRIEEMKEASSEERT